MDKYLRPGRFDCPHDDPAAASQFTHWLKTFSNFIALLPKEPSLDKLQVLINFIAPSIYEYITDVKDFDEALSTLSSLYIRPKNEVFARHALHTRKQLPTESINQFLNALKFLARDCNFNNVSANQYQEESIRDVFVSGLSSPIIRQRLLERHTLSLTDAIDCALTLDTARINAELYEPINQFPINAVNLPLDSQQTDNSQPSTRDSAATSLRFSNQTCFFCGNTKHSRLSCPAKNATCHKCSKMGHFSKVCRSKSLSKTAAAVNSSPIATVRADCVINNSSNSVITVSINGVKVQALVDTGSAVSFIDTSLSLNLGLITKPSSVKVTMASTSQGLDTNGSCHVDLTINDQVYRDLPLLVLSQLCSPVILGRDFMSLHASILFKFNGRKSPLVICALQVMDIISPRVFNQLSHNIRPVAIPTRRYSDADSTFIKKEITSLLDEGIIEDSVSSWRAQTLVVKGTKKNRLVIDYSQTINKFTEPDAFPLPLIDDLAHKIAKNKFFSKLDLKSAYHQIPLHNDDRKYTAFEADGRLYQFCRLPFGLTNAVAVFQRVMQDIIRKHQLNQTYAYLDDVIICGTDQAEHDRNVTSFLDVAKSMNISLNPDKCEFSKTSISYLGYLFCDGFLKPDPQRLTALVDMAIPTDGPALQRLLGLFSYYSRWVEHYSEKIQPLLRNTVFPLSHACQETIKKLKSDILHASLVPFDESFSTVVETDASDHTISGILLQNERPIAFFSRTLKPPERLSPAIEKEAAAIVESVSHWRHLLLGRHFTLVTDQQAVSFIFDKKGRGRTKNDKILRWRIELSTYSYDVKFRPGSLNLGADALTRCCGATTQTPNLQTLHGMLCHPGITRLWHYVRCRNLPHSLEDVRHVCNSCTACRELKPSFLKPPQAHIVKATKPFERISIDFMGPKPSVTRNKYILTVIDEFSRFPFMFPCPDLSASTVVNCLKRLFFMFGLPGAIHSDRGANFMSSEVRNYLATLGIAQTRTTPYHPQGNGQCERYNGVLWKSILLTLRTRKLSTSQWETVMDDVLHAARTLLCTATNETPHERIFSFPRRTSFGSQLPSWLLSPGPVYLRRYVRENKDSPLVEKVDLIQANSNYSTVRFSSGREDTVSNKDLSPAERSRPPLPHAEETFQEVTTDIHSAENQATTHEDPPNSRPVRIRKAPDRLNL